MDRLIGWLAYAVACVATLVILHAIDRPSPTGQMPAMLCLALLVVLHVARARHWRRRWDDAQTALALAETDPVTALPARSVAERRLDRRPITDRTIALVDVNDLHTINIQVSAGPSGVHAPRSRHAVRADRHNVREPVNRNGGRRSRLPPTSGSA